jgi:hypothetical protein
MNFGAAVDLQQISAVSSFFSCVKKKQTYVDVEQKAAREMAFRSERPAAAGTGSSSSTPTHFWGFHC